VLRFFNGNSISVLVLLVLIPFLYWVPDFFRAVPLQDQAFTGTVPALWIASFNAHYRVLSMLIALLIILTNAFLLIQLNTIHIFIHVRTQLPALFYIVLTAGFNPTHQLTPALVDSLLVMIILFRLFVTYKTDGPSVNFMDTGFLIAVASMIYFPAILLFIFLLVALVMLRPLNWREWVYVFLGLMLPYLFVVSGYYIAGVPVREFFHGFSGLFQHHKQTYSIIQLIGWGFIVGMMIYSSYFMASAIDTFSVAVPFYCMDLPGDTRCWNRYCEYCSHSPLIPVQSLFLQLHQELDQRGPFISLPCGDGSALDTIIKASSHRT
jgi:hypothetical protein